jgi:DNA-binding Xre family transcriptional regulator
LAVLELIDKNPFMKQKELAAETGKSPLRIRMMKKVTKQKDIAIYWLENENPFFLICP